MSEMLKKDYSLTKSLYFAVMNIVICFLLFSFLLTNTVAQGKRNIENSPDNSLRSNVRVNPSTLAMEMSIPLGGYSGRAGNSLSNTINYSSKVWQLQEYGIIVNPSGSEGISVVPFYARSTAAGWSSTLAPPRIDHPDDFPYYLEQGADYEGAVWSNIDYGGIYNIFYMRRLYVIMPGGSRHELRAEDTPIQCGYTTIPCNNIDLTGTYLSVDGSRMRLEVTSTSATLFISDGSRIIFESFTGGNVLGKTGVEIIDVHGNRTIYNNTTKEWTDTMGREMPDPLPANINTLGFNNHNQQQTVGDQIIQLPGVGSETVETTLSWRYLKHPTSNDPDDSSIGDIGQDLAYASDLYCDGSYYYTFSGTKLFVNTAASTVRLCNIWTSSPGVPFNPVVLSRVTLANGQSYQFKYNLYGEIERIIHPTGAYERFTYSEIPGLQWTTNPYGQMNRGVTDHYLSEKGDGSDELHWEYSATRDYIHSIPQPYKVRIGNPDGTFIERLIHDEPDSWPQRPYGFDNIITGMPYDERSYSSATTPELLTRTLTGYEATGPLASGYSVATRDVRPAKIISILFEPGNSHAIASMTETVYDTGGNGDPAYFSALNPIQQKTYDYIVINASTAANANLATALGWFSNQDPSTVTESEYLYNSNYKARNINGLVTEIRVKDSAGNVKSKTQFAYDEVGTYPIISAGTHTQWIDPSTNYRGNMTTTKSYYDISNSLYVSTHAQYDNFGNLRKTWDANGNLTQTDYSSSYAYAYPTSMLSAVPDPTGTHGSNTSFTSSTTYDFNTGLPLTSTDANGQTTTMEYDDPLLRPTKVTTPNGQQTITEYGAGTSESTRWVKAKTQIDATNWKEAISWFDGLGRTVRTQSIYAESGDVFALTCYDNMGRVSKTSNPLRNWTTQNCSTANGTNDIHWTTNTFDAAGRPWKVTSPDSAVIETNYSLATSGSQIGTVVTVTDQAGKLRRSITNGLGQLTRVDEPDDSSPTGSLGTISSPNQATYYTYDTLNNLTTVTQGVQTRTFAYDSLSRLLSAANPESGTIGYAYDNNGNLISKIDARTITTTYTYDALNRVKARSYSGESGYTTPTVNYFYDNLTNAKGKLRKVSSSVSTTEYTGFDILGRVTGHKQTTDGAEYSTGYVYNLSGALVEQTYPSGRVVKNIIDGNGDLSIVQSRKNASYGYWNYANSFTYNAAGAVTSMQLGNGRWESTQFNSRLQPTQIALGATNGATNLLKLDYSYGTTANNGNVMSQTITVPTVGIHTGFTAVQNYTYDTLNRLESATENIDADPTPSWKQAFMYDRYGNRNFDEANTTFAGFDKLCDDNSELCADLRKILNPSINPNNNRLNTSEDYDFDDVGNTTEDPQGRTFIYDAENKQVEVKDHLDNTIGEYFYDGDGKRVKKVVPSTGEVTIFVYDAAGKSIAEYSTTISNDPKVSYTTADHLGSPRILTDENGATISRRDFHPFGEEVFTTERTSNLGYQPDDVRQKFTTYERDTETDLDFAQARMYNKNHGRFTTVDDFTKDSNLKDPQSWNKYIYVRNNPLNLIDPTGEKAKIDVQVNRETKVVTLTITASVGLWSTPGTKFKPNLAKVQKNVEAQLKKWGGSLKIDGGYTLNVKTNVTVKTFDSARSSDDVLKTDNSIMNVIQLVDRPAATECGGGNSCIGGGDPATINNPDGTLPDIGTWRYTTARDKNEPAHEFFHILGKSHNSQEQYGAGWTGKSFAEQGTRNTSGATLYDYTRAFGDDVTRAINDAKKEGSKWYSHSKTNVVVRPTRIVRCCTP